MIPDCDVIIVGGGAAGLFAAAELSENGKKVLVIEPNRILGRKLRITGKGRCNLTNNCTSEEVMKNVLRNPKFLYSTLSKLPPEDIMRWFEAHGVPLKTERGRRVFPVSDRADDVAESMVRVCKAHGVRVLRTRAERLLTDENGIFGVKCTENDYLARRVILATGGKSYPKTGSDGSGYNLAASLGHSIVEPRPSLVPIELSERFCEGLAGLTLKNVELSLYDCSKPKKPLYRELGELTFMSYGISGPLGISASCFMKTDRLICKGYNLYIDLKPGLTAEQLDARLLRDISASPQSDFMSLLCGLLPRNMAEILSDLLEFDKPTSIGNLTKEQRTAIVTLLKHFELTPIGLRPFDEAIVTCGGISTKEIDPATMESKLVKGLYFAGEILDCDGFTGGYNLTIAFSTANAAVNDIILSKDVEKWD